MVWPAVGVDDDDALALDELRVPRDCGDSADESLRVARSGSAQRNGACSVPARDRRSDRQRIGARIGGTSGAGRPGRSASGPGESHTSEDSPSVSPAAQIVCRPGAQPLVTMSTIISKSTLTSSKTSDRRCPTFASRAVTRGHAFVTGAVWWGSPRWRCRSRRCPPRWPRSVPARRYRPAAGLGMALAAVAVQARTLVDHERRAHHRRL